MASQIPFNDIRVLSFDIYGTLIDWECGIYTSLKSSALSPFLPSSRKQVLEGFETHQRTIQRDQPTLRQSEINAEAVRRYARDLGADTNGPDKLSEAEVEDASVTFGEAIGSWPAFEDTVVAIQRLKKRYKLVPLSNIDRATFARTLAGPLAGCEFDAIYTAEDIGSYKPDPRNFEYLLEHIKQDFGVGKEQLLHVAQSLFHDHEPAKKFGLKSVWVDRSGFIGELDNESDEASHEQRYGYKLRVETLKELADVVDEVTS